MSEPASRERPTADPNYILSQEEFHTTLRAHADYQVAAEGRLHRVIAREADGLRKTAGWMFFAFACWFIIAGMALLSGGDRGRPDRG